MVGYTRLVSFGHVAAYGLGAYASGYMLLNIVDAAAVRRDPRRAADRHRRHRRRLGVHARDRRLVLDADAGVRPAPLRHRLQVDLGDGRLGRSRRHPATRGADGHHAADDQDRLLLLRARLPGRHHSCCAASSSPRPSARCCAAFARTRPRRSRSATTPASTRSPSSPSPTRSAAWPARSTRRLRASPTPSCCSGCSRARC